VAPRRLDSLHVAAQNRIQRTVGQQLANLLRVVPLEREAAVRAAFATASSRIIAGGQWKGASLALAYVNTLAPPVAAVDLAAIEATLVTAESPAANVGLGKLFEALDLGAGELEARDEASLFASGIGEGEVQGTSRLALDEGVRASGREPRWRLEPNSGACEWCLFVAGTGARYLSAQTVPVPHARDNPRHPGGPCGCSPVLELESEVQ
jgi:hypothetical protein